MHSLRTESHPSPITVRSDVLASIDIDISLVIPAHNERHCLPALLENALHTLTDQGTFEVIVVDDGSTDGTFEIIYRASQMDPRIRYVRLSRNFGHQAAVRAGLAYSSGRCVISMDADLQHPVDLLPELIQKWRDGYEVVVTSRRDSPDVPRFKRWTSRLFYRLFNYLSEVSIDPGSADFRLLDRAVVNVINELSESDFFLRGIIPWVGFAVACIPYTPNARLHGDSHYTLRKMIAFALSAVVANSIRPLRLAILLAALVSCLATLYGIYALVIYFSHETVAGWTSVVLVVCFTSSLQLLVLGIIGEYVGRILREARKRHPFIVAATNCKPEPKDFNGCRN